MNILPKKRWHVRTKENVARVQRDEENARVQEELERGRVLKAESEARINLLRKQAVSKYENSATSAVPTEHINFFSSVANKTNNLEAVKDKEKEQKEWEMKVGYLKLLGQGSSELADDKPWYQKKPDELVSTTSNTSKRSRISNSTDLLDPFAEMKKRAKTVDYVTPVPDAPETVFVDIDFRDKVVDFSNERRKYGKIRSNQETEKDKKKKKHKKKHKKKKHRESSSDDNDCQKKSLIQLREERLKREQAEHIRTQKMLNPDTVNLVENTDNLAKPKMKQKYNSQFNPSFVKSNYSKRR